MKLFNIVGPLSSGKSTLLEALRVPLTLKCLEDDVTLKMLPECVRLVWRDKYEGKYESLEQIMTEADLFLNWQWDLLRKYEQQLSEASKYDIVISDRGPLDIMLYTVMHGNCKNPLYGDILQRCVALYGLVDWTFVTMPLPIENDILRPATHTNQRYLEIIMFKDILSRQCAIKLGYNIDENISSILRHVEIELNDIKYHREMDGVDPYAVIKELRRQHEEGERRNA